MKSAEAKCENDNVPKIEKTVSVTFNNTFMMDRIEKDRRLLDESWEDGKLGSKEIQFVT